VVLGEVMTRAGRHQRSGLSLLEVLVALAILLFALVGLERLVSLGGDRAVDVQQQARGSQLCESKMAEVASGVVQLSSQGDTPFDEDPDWQWSLDCEQGNVQGLWTVTVTVSRVHSAGSGIKSTLTQMLVAPSQRGVSGQNQSLASSSQSSSTSSSP
jgi:general secretion pathway protein I